MILSLTPNIPESYSNIKEELDILQIKDISPESVVLNDGPNVTAEELAFAGDMKIQNILTGIQCHSATVGTFLYVIFWATTFNWQGLNGKK